MISSYILVMLRVSDDDYIYYYVQNVFKLTLDYQSVLKPTSFNHSFYQNTTSFENGCLVCLSYNIIVFYIVKKFLFSF